MRYYHHTVTGIATPFGDFTKRCKAVQLADVNIKQTRIAHLDAVLQKIYDGNKSAMARAAAERSDKQRNPSFFIELLGGKKSFGEKLARTLENELQLGPKSLDEPVDGGGSNIVQLVPAWPFSFPRSRFDRLSPTQKAKIEGRIEEMIATFEALAPKKSRHK